MGVVLGVGVVGVVLGEREWWEWCKVRGCDGSGAG